MGNQLHRLLGNGNGPIGWTPKDGPRRLTGRLRIATNRLPIDLDLSGRSLRLYPAELLDPGERDVDGAWIIVDPKRFFSSIAGFVRIGLGESVLVGRANERYKNNLELAKPVRKRHLEISNQGNILVLTPLDTEGTTSVAAVTEQDEVFSGLDRHLRNIKRARDILGRPIELWSPDEALSAVRRVNDILQKEAHRPKNSDGRPGGVLTLPNELVPIIVGDLHSRVDNLLKILSQSDFLKAVSRGEAYFLFLGDLVHSEADDELAKMDSSLLLVDLFVKLKLAFPEHVYCLRGNHESFDESVGKAGVPQGLLFRKHAVRMRGRAYADELERLFESLPYVAKTDRFAACHGGPPRAEASFQDLVDVARRPKLARELTWNRPMRPGYPIGFTKRNVKQFRSSLGVAKHTPLIVGHTHLTRDETVWVNASDIKNLHVVTCANQHNLAVFIGLGQDMVPLEYVAEPLLKSIDAASDEVGPRAPLGASAAGAPS